MYIYSGRQSFVDSIMKNLKSCGNQSDLVDQIDLALFGCCLGVVSVVPSVQSANTCCLAGGVRD